MDSSTPPRPSRSFLGVLRRLDDGVFVVEQAIVSLALITITAVLFVDVVARRATARDSKVGALVSKLAGIEDEATRAWVDTHAAPWVSIALTLLIVGFGAYAARRFARQRAAAAEGTTGAESKGETPPTPDPKRETGIALGAGLAAIVAVWALMQAFAQLDSWLVYALFFGLSAAGYVAYQGREKAPGWGLRAGAGAIFGALLAYLSWDWIPEGYTWSKQISLQLLLWVGMLSASICVYAGKHLRIEATAKLVPAGAAGWVKAAGMMLGAGFCGLMAYLGFRYVFAPEASDDAYLTEFFSWGGTRYVYGFEGLIGQGGMIEGTATDRHIDGIPNWVGILAAPLGFGIAALRFTGAAASAAFGGAYGAAAADEDMEDAKAAARENRSSSSPDAAQASDHDGEAQTDDGEAQTDDGEAQTDDGEAQRSDDAGEEE